MVDSYHYRGVTDRLVGAALARPTHRRNTQVDLLWIIIIVLIFLAVLGYFGRGRFR